MIFAPESSYQCRQVWGSIRDQRPSWAEMAAQGRRTINPSLDGDRWSGSADAYAPGLWQSGHRTNNWTVKG